MTTSRLGWPRLKVAVALSFLLFFTALPYLVYCSDLSQRLPPAQTGRSLSSRLEMVGWTADALFLQQLEDGRSVLPSRGTIGFVCETRPSLTAYYLAQYALSPLVVRSDADAPLVICYFDDARALTRIRRTRKLTRWVEMDFKNGQKNPNGYKPQPRRVPPSQSLVLRHDFGRGLLLFEKSSSQRAASGGQETK